MSSEDLFHASGIDLPEVRELLRQGVDLDGYICDLGWKQLWQESYKGHTQIVRELLAAGAFAYLANKDGWDPLIIAARYGQHDCVKALLGAWLTQTSTIIIVTRRSRC